MSVVLEPPLTRSGVWPHGARRECEALAVGPRYARTPAMSRWHRVRSGVRWSSGGISYGLWCGQHIHSGADPATCDRVTDAMPICGTCEGRAIGAGQDGWHQGPGLIFTPNRLTAPKHCPGSRSTYLFTEAGHNVGRCLVCAELAPVRAMGGWHNPRVAITQHPPGDGLIPGCPFHAWRELRVHDGAAVCACRLQPSWETP